jgi:hypothetical protein
VSIAHSMELPRPANWQEFEKMVRDAMAQRWQSSKLTMYGRPGQKQLGIDIQGVDELGRAVGIQCKRSLGPLRFSTVVREVENARLFGTRLATLFIATTAGHDAVLLEEVRMLSESNTSKGVFGVGLLFWDEIVASLSLNYAVFASYYPRQVTARSLSLDRDRKLCALELGFYCTQLATLVETACGDGVNALPFEPDKAVTFLRIVERRAHQLFHPTDAKLVSDAVSAIEKHINNDSSVKDWLNIRVNSQRIFKWVNSAAALISFENLNAFQLGVSLGRVCCSSSVPTKAFKSGIQEQALIVLGPYSHSRTVTAFLSISSIRETRRWASKAFTLIDREIRYAS